VNLFGRPMPRHEFVDAGLRPAIDQARQHVGEVALRIDQNQLAGLDKRGHSGPTREWLNSVVAVVALVASGASTYLAWQGNQAKREALAMVAHPTDACQTEYHGGEEHGLIGLCWSVGNARERE
jgi:hypothetical protein